MTKDPYKLFLQRSSTKRTATLDEMRVCLDQVETVFRDAKKLSTKKKKRNRWMVAIGIVTTVTAISGFFKSLSNHDLLQCLVWLLRVFLVGSLTIKIHTNFKEALDQQNPQQKKWLDQQFSQYPWFATYYGMTQRLYKKEDCQEELYEKKFVEGTRQFLQLMDWLPYKIDRKTATIFNQASLLDLIKGPLNDTMIFLVRSQQHAWWVTSKTTGEGNQRNYVKIDAEN